MDVQCPACKTEYEFDDALVSERGTTVRCTTCAHQFRLKRPEGQPARPDRWVVTSDEDGSEHTYSSLRELQRAILSKQLSRADKLSRDDGEPPRPLGSIAELEPFFQGRPSSRPPPPPASSASRPPPPPEARSGGTLRPPSTASAVPPVVTLPESDLEPASVGSFPDAAATPHVRAAREEDVPTAVHPANLARGIAESRDGAPHEPRPSRPPPPLRDTAAPVPLARTTRVGLAPPPAGSRPRISRPPPAPALEASSPLPPPTIVVETPAAVAVREGQAGDRTSGVPSSDVGLLSVAPPRPRVGGWVVAAALLGGLGAVGYATVRARSATDAAAAATRVDPRAQQHLADAERAFAEGRLEAAKESADKAQALDENGKEAATLAARIAVARADVPWLRQRLLPEGAAGEQELTRVELEELAARVQRAAEALARIAPDAPSTVRVAIDANRQRGAKDAARALVPKVAASAAEPDTAAALALLDLAEPEPLWSTVVDRLRLAAAAEGGLGRARAALVYALARSGDAAGARAELEKLGGPGRPHPLSTTLRAFVDRAPGGATAKKDAGPPTAAATPREGTAPATATPTAGGGGEPRNALQAAEAAARKGDHARAKTFYEAILAKNPNDSEALAGMGDVARAQRDPGSAKSFYQQALAANPTYLPALVGLGDVQWDTGDREAARKTYRDIGERFPEAAYPARVKARAEGTTTLAAPTAPPAGSAVEDEGSPTQ